MKIFLTILSVFCLLLGLKASMGSAPLENAKINAHRGTNWIGAAFLIYSMSLSV